MSKKLTLHQKGTTEEHWFSSVEYTNKQIEAISELDPRGGKTDTPPTSIPSPFAQIDLVLTAFQRANKDKTFRKLDKIDFKLISDALDIGEIFFNYAYLKQETRFNLEIVEWNKKDELDTLINSPNQKHQRLGAALALYLNQDEKAYNFSLMESIYILKYDNKVIGATSPATLFFSTANNLGFVDIKMNNGHQLFTSDYRHLYQRDEDFQKWFYSLMKATNHDCKSKFSDIAQYLDYCLDILHTSNRSLYQELNALNSTTYSIDESSNLYGRLSLKNGRGVYLLSGIPLLCLKKNEYSNTNQLQSDFCISSQKYIGTTPLVLKPNHDGIGQNGQSLRYYTGNYDRKIDVPFKDDKPLADRFLPGISGVKYPYLTVSDFLEPYLIRLPYPINEQKFFNGNIKRSGLEKDYLLPIKKEFFAYFDVEDLETMLTMTYINASSVSVQLKIPIQKGNYISYERTYTTSANTIEILPPNEFQNKGRMVEYQIGVVLYPFLKMDREVVRPNYRVMFIDTDRALHHKHLNYKISFYNCVDSVSIKSSTRRMDKKANSSTSTTDIYAVQENFEYIQISNGVATGIVIPKFKVQQMGQEQFHFAIDFGTTNTHIEYKADTNPKPRPFDIQDQDLQIATLHDPSFIDRNPEINGTPAAGKIFTNVNPLFPQKIGGRSAENTLFKFPQRTVILNKKDLGDKDIATTLVFNDFNIPFSYEKLTIAETDFNMIIATNLKWGKIGGKMEGKRVEMFFESLLFMIRNKVLMNGGDLNRTKLTVFYPTSMSKARKNDLRRQWNEKFKIYITDISRPLLMQEGLAPFYYFLHADNVNASVKPALSIDIGGGTTDIVVFKQESPLKQVNKPIMQTSFRFAANAVFGNGLNKDESISNNKNGFVEKYKQTINTLLESVPNNNKKTVFLSLFQQITEGGKADDIINFFFSLEDNPNFTREVNRKFSDILFEDDDMRLVYLVFYAAIIYHIAKLMKYKQIDMPTFITFSGNGSKILNILSSDNKTLENLTKTIFQIIYKKDAYDKEGLKIKRLEDLPKLVTCKGGLMLSPQEEEEVLNEDAISAVLIAKKDNNNIIDNNVIDNANSFTYGNIKETDFASIAAEVEYFFDFLFNEIGRKFSFTKEMGIRSVLFSKYKELLKEETLANIHRGVSLKAAEITDQEIDTAEIEETLFFYPIIAALNRLAYQIYLDTKE